MKGIAIRLNESNNINTDYIISGRYKFSISDPKELAKHIFEDIEPGFVKRLKKDNMLVAGKNFGMGSSREQAPVALKSAGIKAVIAKSFARIFYRNAFNVGLLLIECETNKIKDGDKLMLDIKKDILKNLTANKTIKIIPLPDFMMRFITEGGAVEYFKKHKKW